MKPRKFTYLAHRWLALIVAIQLLAWSVGGFIFSVLKIEGVRGESDSRLISHAPINLESIESLPTAVQEGIKGLGDQLVVPIGTVSLTDRGLGAYWEIRDTDLGFIARLNINGQPTGLISPTDAGTIAMSDFIPEATIVNTTLIESDSPSEYRGGALPSYRVELGHPKHPHIYIDAHTGQIRARRNDSWRTFDFFWMLHTMDYSGRDNFNHPLLSIASMLAILTSLTGISLWLWRVLPKLRRKK